VLGHKEFDCPDRPFLTKVNLRELDCQFDREILCEHAFFLRPLISEANYLGFATWQWDKKFRFALPLEKLDTLPFSPTTLMAPWGASMKWPDESDEYFPGMKRYLRELAEWSGLELGLPGFYMNNFLCHRDVYLAFQKWFGEAFQYFYDKYQYDYDMPGQTLRHVAGYFYERWACLYFGNRRDLTITDAGRREHSV
jgi:hypothetical protein